MKIVISLVICLTSVTFCFTQAKRQNTTYRFPDADSEFVVTFPKKPEIRTIYGNERSGQQAELFLEGLSFIRAENNPLSPTEISRIKEMSDETFSKIPLNYATNIGLSNPVVSVGNGSLGRYAKLRGFTKLENIMISYEVYMYFGEKSAISLYAAGPSAEFPSPAILKFLNSLRRASKQ